MPLQKCLDCGKEISTAAYSCPHCGKPNRVLINQSSKIQRKGGIFEAIGFILIICGIFSCLVNSTLGILLIVIGFIIFLIGRFL